MRFIRTELRPDFLVIVNGGGKLVGPITGPLVNGSFMETVAPADKSQADMPANLHKFENTLNWSETTLREPRINLLGGWANRGSLSIVRQTIGGCGCSPRSV